MMKEIGSEFEWKEPFVKSIRSSWFPKCSDSCLTFSGRTAFETVITDIGEMRKVCFPLYCCDSMIEAFRKTNATIEFYCVDYTDEFSALLCIPEDCDVLVLCNYFGYRVEYPVNEIIKFKNRGGIVIEDITHSLLSKQQYHLYSDYLVASLRKWEAVLCGGLCCKLNGEFKVKPQKLPDRKFIELKTKAMRLKYEYINNSSDVNKTKFLEMYAESNQFFETDYSNVKIDKRSEELLEQWDVDKIRTARQKNATLLHHKLKDNVICKTIFKLADMDCPLFVPIIVSDGKRDLMKQELIKKNIYCPVHWPRPNAVCDSLLYDAELSLVCDQRYTENDMMHIIDVINSFKE